MERKYYWKCLKISESKRSPVLSEKATHEPCSRICYLKYKIHKKQLALLNRVVLKGNYTRKDTEKHTLVCQYNISLLISFFFFISGTSFNVSSIVERLPILLPPHLGSSIEWLIALQIELKGKWNYI